MNTVVAKIDIKNPDLKILEKAAEIIKKGGLVGFPTETVYGLGANALDEKAVGKIFIAKKRPSDNPIITHISDTEQLNSLVSEITPIHKKLIQNFWPGPLTLLFNKKTSVPSVLTAGLSTITVRFPSHPVARDLIRLSKVPIAAPSANLSGSPSPTNAQHVIEDLNGRVDMIIDGGPTTYGLESTVLDPMNHPPRIIRNGALSIEEIRRILPDITDATRILDNNKPLSPGMKYRHYAPRAKVVLVGPENIKETILSYLRENSLQEKEAGLLVLQNINPIPVESVICKDTQEMSVCLFDVFRKFDRENKKVIFVEKPVQIGIGKAILDRLERASG